MTGYLVAPRQATCMILDQSSVTSIVMTRLLSRLKIRPPKRADLHRAAWVTAPPACWPNCRQATCAQLCPAVANQLWPRVLDGSEDHMMQSTAFVLTCVPLRSHVKVIDQSMFPWKSWWRNKVMVWKRSQEKQKHATRESPGWWEVGVTLVQTYRGALGTAYVTPQHCLSWAVSTLELGLWLRAGLMHGFPSFLV